MFEKNMSALIEPEELLGKLVGSARTKIIDASFFMPGAASDQQGVYKSKRIGNAAFFDIDEIADKSSDLPHMLPSPDEFAHAVSGLGISSDDEVIIYGQDSMAMGPARAWWMFRVFGHDNVRVLNGSLKTWENAGFPVVTEPPAPAESGDFKAGFRPELVADIHAMRRASKDNNAGILDARGKERFEGNTPEPRPGLSSGHIPGSRCLPCMELIVASSGKLKDRDELRRLFEGVELNADMPVMTTCGSGVTACLLALGLYESGYPDVAVYDGSWAEWGRTETGMKIASGA